jgi:hypothetical protein
LSQTGSKRRLRSGAGTEVCIECDRFSLLSKIGFHAKRFGQGKSPPNGGIAPHQPLRRPVESPFDRGLTELSLKPAHCASWTGSSRPRRPPSGSSAKCTQNTGLMLSKTHHSRLFWTVVTVSRYFPPLAGFLVCRRRASRARPRIRGGFREDGAAV